MNYPVWVIPEIGGFNLIAIMSILHVFVAHFAVGGGALIWMMERKAQGEPGLDLRDYLRGFAGFFVLLTMVFGGLTGVGIWFIIALVSPQATSLLIHTFVYGWAIEWVFFIVEIVSILVYYYKFDALNERARRLTTFIYFVSAWLSLAVINGIVSFMLTPGNWINTKDFWDGLLNPSYFPSTLFRTFYSFIVAGIFGLFIASLKRKMESTNTVIKLCSKLILFSIPLLALSGLWYYNVLSEEVKATTFVLNYESKLWVRVILLTTCAIAILSTIVVLVRQRLLLIVISVILIPTALMWIGGFEYLRELSRKPYVIYGYMYSNSILVSEAREVEEKGLLSKARWVTRERQGEGLFSALCLPCHTLGGPNRDLKRILAGIPKMGIMAYLTGQGKLYTYMPRLYGRQEELAAIADSLAQKIGTVEVHKGDKGPLTWEKADVPSFDGERDEYVLLAWSELGIHCITDMDRYLSILPPGNTIEALLIRRGEVPEVVTTGVKIFYELETGFLRPSSVSEFWRYSRSLYGVGLELDRGFSGNGPKGEMVFKKEKNAFVAEGVPVVPYSEDGRFMPYPLISIKAIEEGSQKVLAQTSVVAPVSSEVGCTNCHGGPWKFQGKTGMSEKTAQNILLLHDKRHKTQLLKDAESGRPKACSQCHKDSATNMLGSGEVLNLSAAIHGFHALYVPFQDERACNLCHPSSSAGVTRCFRGLHREKGMGCTDCHGPMERHAMGLLRNEASKPKAPLLIKAMKAQDRDALPREPWKQEPHCLRCHRAFGSPEIPEDLPISDGTLYRESVDHMGIRCMACHGSTHALYPAANPYDEKRDNLQPVQYTGRPTVIGAGGSCVVCHRVEMKESAHHPNMVRD